MKRVLRIVLLLLLGPGAALGDGGVLIPRDKAQPDPSILSLEEMEITVQIDNGDARVFVRQVFVNHTSGIEEGNYIFALPSEAAVSDFAVWDGTVRIPAVILERKRAGEIYDQLKQQSIDPGLLQMGERGTEEAKRSAIFSARIVPIPAYGTKRLEFEYHEAIPVENLKSYFAIPLRPDAYQVQSARHLRINFELKSAHPTSDFTTPSKVYPLALTEQTAQVVRGTFEGENVSLSEDFVATFDLDKAGSDALAILTHRSPVSGEPSPVETAPVRSTNEPGFFSVDALLGFGASNKAPAPASAPAGPPKTVVVLLDTSLSMQWEKLERSYQALETLLRALKPNDRFNLVVFNSQVQTFQPAPVPVDGTSVGRALDFVRASRLRGATDLQKPLEEALRESRTSGPNQYVVLLSDGGSTKGLVRNARLAAWYETEWKRLPEATRPKTYIFGVGDDANVPLFRLLARENGVFETVLSTEPIDFKLTSFLSKIGRSPVGELGLTVTPESAVDSVYPLQDEAFAGSHAVWVGRYRSPAEDVGFAVHGVRDGTALALSGKADLPRESDAHAQLPRLWARARVDALLEKIERDGEDAASVAEIIRLSRQYKFVTPYTSFLAVPRALLRPRVIRPGDPVIRVKTDPGISSVVALFPFGLVKKLRYLPDEDIWQTRFLVPTDLADGTYPVRLVMRDRAGETYRESKTFVIASESPTVEIRLPKRRYQKGEALPLKVAASLNARTLVARLEGAAPADLHWDPKAGASTGILLIPDAMIPGTYRLTVTAEDIAHNMGSQEVDIEVVP
jgi:Ca-activated chloride channel homolog